MIPPALFFFLRVVLAIWGLWWFHIYFRILLLLLLFYFCEKCHWYFDRNCIKSVDSFR